MAVKLTTIRKNNVTRLTSAALKYLHEHVSQNVRNQYTGETTDRLDVSNDTLVLSISLKHSCGTLLVERTTIVDNVASWTEGMALAKNMMRQIDAHQRACNIRIQTFRPCWHDDATSYDGGADKKRSKPKPKKCCEICGEQDTIKYPEWPECEHERQDATISREKSVEDKRTAPTKRRVKKRPKYATQKIRRPKDRTAQRQSALAGPRKPTNGYVYIGDDSPEQGKVRRNFG